MCAIRISLGISPSPVKFYSPQISSASVGVVRCTYAQGELGFSVVLSGSPQVRKRLAWCGEFSVLIIMVGSMSHLL